MKKKKVEYRLVEYKGRKYAEPIGESQGGDDTLVINSPWPLQDTPCSKCGVYGLVKVLGIGKWQCVNCGATAILVPKQQLHIKKEARNDENALDREGERNS